MTIRLCIFGNSHVAALRDAWLRHPERWPNITADFIGAHRNGLLETQIDGQRLAPFTGQSATYFAAINKCNTVDLRAYDGFVIAGALVSAAVTLQLYREARWPELPSLAKTALKKRLLISDNAAAAFCQAKLAARLGPLFATHLRSGGVTAPIWITSQPRLSAACRARGCSPSKTLSRALRSGDGPALSALFDSAADAACQAAGARFLAQPEQSRQSALLTRPCFMNGAIRLTGLGREKQPKQDFMHANATYGAAVLDQIAAAALP
ncbi:MAG: hypothetical protein COB93_10675 [Sneathiella sp.]|nr:MAG: hypothetical protein COB93_10675 [Sneathiella sp.]